MAVTLVEFLQDSFPLFSEYPEEQHNGMMEVRAIFHLTCVYMYIKSLTILINAC